MTQSKLASTEKRAILPFRDILWLLTLIGRTAPLTTGIWVLLTLIDGALEAIGFWAVRGAVNALIAFGTTPSRATVILWLIALGGVFTGQQVIQLVQPYIKERVRVVAGFALQNTALTKMGQLSLEAFDVGQTHDLVQRVAEGADTRGPELVGDALDVIRLIPTILVSAFVLGLISPWIPVFIMAGDALLLWYGIRMGTKERQFEVEQTRQRRLGDYYADLLTTRGHAAEVRLWGLYNLILSRWRNTLTDYFHAKLRVLLKNAVSGVGQSVGFTVLLVAAPVAATLGGSVEPGLAALVLVAIRSVCVGMYMILGSARRFIANAGFATDLRQLLEDMEEQSPEEAQLQTREVSPSTSDSSGWLRFPRPIRRGIRLQGISYRYPGVDRQVLTDIDVEIKSGEIVALVGPNGAGKTTLASILVGLRRPTAGAVLVDGIDLSRIQPSEILSACTAVFQHPMRYPTTLRENVTLGTSSSTDRLMEEALAMAGFDGRGPSPNTLLGVEFGGTDLSGGEWQRVAIARGLFGEDTELVVFDEPTASLDALAELALFEQFAKLAAGRTTILISHRLGPTRLADQVLVLEAGRLIEAGPPNKLLAADGRFAQMFAAQARWYQ